ncbi:MAG: hypothetical protein RLZZ483_637, partial [Actinomycetota bacterium]
RNKGFAGFVHVLTFGGGSFISKLT